MQRIFKSLLAIILIVFAIQSVHAQKYDLETKIPVDPNLRIGKLDNGLTYYIRHNEKPENRAEMRLFLRVGSIVEDEDQLGLAHLVEHMCFNGTENFEKNEIIHYIQSIGMSFGPDLNGFTGFDETGYMISVPTDSADFYDKGMLIMEDWAHRVTFDHEEIDKERDIVIEEWRLGQGAQQRMRDQYFPVLLKDSRYAERLPIGKKEIIENADYETIKRYYNDWYRPELMSFVVVGDIDVDQTEKMIKERFSNIESPEETKERTIYEVPDHDERLVAVVADKENPYTQVALFIKNDVKVYNTLADLRRQLIGEIFTGMVNQRLNELKEQADPPFVYSGSYMGSVLSKSFYEIFFVVKEDGIERGVNTMLEETERVKKYGFTDGELERYKKTILKNYENQFNEREKTPSESYTWEYMAHFVEGKPIPGKEFMYEFSREVVPEITLEEVNQMAQKTIIDKNNVMLVLGIEKEGVNLPAKDDVYAWMNDFDGKTVEPYKDKVIADELMAEKPEPGEIVEETFLGEIDAQELTLSNGAKVVLKQTDFQDDEINIQAMSEGGQSLYGLEDHFNAMYASRLMNECGVGPFNQTDLRKFLAGKKVNLFANISMNFEGLHGSCGNDDIETLMQMLYLSFTNPRYDEEAMASFMNREKEMLRNQSNDPVRVFYDQVAKVNFQDHPRAYGRMVTAENIESIDPKRSYDIFKERFADASDFTIHITGSFDEDEMKELISTYLASLPAQNKPEKCVDLGIRTPDKQVTEHVYKGTDKKSFISLHFELPVNATQDEEYLFEQLGQYLDIRYVDILREEMSGVYGFGVQTKINITPYEYAFINIIIPCSPDNVEKLKEAALAEIMDVQENGITDDYLNKIKKTAQRNVEEGLKENSYWMTAFSEIYKRHENYDRLAKAMEQTELITSEGIRDVARKFINLDVYAQVVLYPEDMAKIE